MDTLIEIGIGAIFELPTKSTSHAKFLNDPMYWSNAKVLKDAEEIYRELIKQGYPLLFHVYAENQNTTTAEALAIKEVLGEYASCAKFEGGVGERKLPFQSLCCVDDNVPYLNIASCDMKAIIDRPYNSEIAMMEYRNVLKQMYRLTEPTQMKQLVKFMNNRKDVFIK